MTTLLTEEENKYLSIQGNDDGWSGNKKIKSPHFILMLFVVTVAKMDTTRKTVQKISRILVQTYKQEETGVVVEVVATVVDMDVEMDMEEVVVAFVEMGI